MASINNTFTFHFILLILFSLSLQPHARESKFFTKVIHYLSNSPKTSSSSLVPSPAPVLVPELFPVTEPLLAPAPAPTEKEYGYGLYGQGSSEFSSEEYHTSSIDGSNYETAGDEEEKATLASEEFTSEKDAPFEKLLSSESYPNSNNGYSNNGNGYPNSMNENNGYNHNGYKNKKNGYNQYGYNNGDGYNQNGYTNNNGNGYNQNGYTNNNGNQNGYTNNGNGYNHNGYNNENGYNQNGYNNYEDNANEYASSMNENNGYKTDRYSQNNYHNYNYMSFTNENNGYNGNGYTRSKEENNGYNGRYMVKQQGLSETRFLENGKYSYDANNNGNNHETSYEEQVRGNGDGYNGNKEVSKYEFDTMDEYERQEGYPESDQRGYVP
ncbi:putative protein E6 [Helianthus debilis subsp. tardiflorus]